MTEREWSKCTSPETMIGYLASLVSSSGAVRTRKKRLFALACCHRIDHLLTDARCREELQIAEEYAERQVSSEEHQAAWAAVLSSFSKDTTALRAVLCAKVAGWGGASGSAAQAQSQEPVPTNFRRQEPSRRERAFQCQILRDIFGNPFGPVAFTPTWLTATVKVLASSIYAEKTFEWLPILADALEETGCTSPDLLAHCRQSGVHVRGCWAVDLLLETE
jgi:hypothetical protein